ncbi:MAG: DUF2202 domain-containing protein [Candidatus Omnitrophica bacterium]|nr:DUF2202 domain-containing protein [Candidatus Omnitrophota bacterium]
MACHAAVEGEIENIRLYDRLILTTTKEAILQVFNHLQDGSTRHLNAFQRRVNRYD